MSTAEPRKVNRSKKKRKTLVGAIDVEQSSVTVNRLHAVNKWVAPPRTTELKPGTGPESKGKEKSKPSVAERQQDKDKEPETVPVSASDDKLRKELDKSARECFCHSVRESARESARECFCHSARECFCHSARECFCHSEPWEGPGSSAGGPRGHGESIQKENLTLAMLGRKYAMPFCWGVDPFHSPHFIKILLVLSCNLSGGEGWKQKI